MAQNGYTEDSLHKIIATLSLTTETAIRQQRLISNTLLI